MNGVLFCLLMRRAGIAKSKIGPGPLVSGQALFLYTTRPWKLSHVFLALAFAV